MEIDLKVGNKIYCVGEFIKNEYYTITKGGFEKMKHRYLRAMIGGYITINNDRYTFDCDNCFNTYKRKTLPKMCSCGHMFHNKKCADDFGYDKKTDSCGWCRRYGQRKS